MDQTLNNETFIFTELTLFRSHKYPKIVSDFSTVFQKNKKYDQEIIEMMIVEIEMKIKKIKT